MTAWDVFLPVRFQTADALERIPPASLHPTVLIHSEDLLAGNLLNPE